jgi:hypothetical protein
MSDKPISPLRRRMHEDMNVRRIAPDTQCEYVRALKRLAAFLVRSPDIAIAEELRAFQVHLTETGVRPPTINATGSVTNLPLPCAGATPAAILSRLDHADQRRRRQITDRFQKGAARIRSRVLLARAP